MRNELLRGFYPGGGLQEIQQEMNSTPQQQLRRNNISESDDLEMINRFSMNADQMFKTCGCRIGTVCPCEIT